MSGSVQLSAHMSLANVCLPGNLHIPRRPQTHREMLMPQLVIKMWNGTSGVASGHTEKTHTAKKKKT